MAQAKTRGDLFASMEDDLKQFWAALSGALGAAAGAIAQRAGIVGAVQDAMPLVPDAATFRKRLAALPLATYQAGETVLAAGSRSGRLLILRNGAVAIIKDAIEIAKVAEPGAVFGELSALLDQPHTADVRALETSQFHVADAANLLSQDSVALLYVAEVLARRLDGANRALIELKNQLQAGQPRSVINKTVEKVEEMLGGSGASLVYAGYPYDPYA
jgi:CRP/FNR family cyclic AMP-dependent transcriptional regulator